MKPDFIIKTKTKDLTALIKSCLISLTVVDDKGFSADTLTLTLDNRENRFAIPKTGTDLICYLGYEGALQYVGQFAVDDITLTFPASVLVLKATAARQRSLYREKRTHSFTGLNLSEILDQIARRNLFEPRISPALASINIPHVLQKDQSDSDLVVRLMQRYGVTIKPVDGKLVAVPGGDQKNVSGNTLPAIDLDISQISSGSVNLTGRRQYTAVRASFVNVDMGATVWINEGDIEGRVMQLEERFGTEDEARQAAKSKLNEVQRKHYALHIEMPGEPGIQVERLVRFRGHPDERVSGEWRVIRSEHSLSSRGFTTRFEAIAPRRKQPVLLQ